MLHLLLPLVTFAAAEPDAPREAPSPRAAQVQLAEQLAAADAIESVEVRDRLISFSIIREGAQLRVGATTGRDGTIVGLEVEPAGTAGAELHALTWLAAELADVPAVVRLVPAERGTVLMSTSDGRRYLVAPRTAPRTGNEAVDARWGAAWSQPGA